MHYIESIAYIDIGMSRIHKHIANVCEADYIVTLNSFNHDTHLKLGHI